MKGLLFILVITIVGTGFTGYAEAATKKTAKTQLTVQERKLQREKKALEYKIMCANQAIARCQEKIKNLKFVIVEFDKEDAKGWYYRKNGNSTSLHSMSSLPRKYRRRDIVIVNISKDEKRAKMKKNLLAEINKKQKEVKEFEQKIASLK